MGPDGATYKNHLVFQNMERPHLFVVDHLSGPKYHGAVTFDDVGNTTRVTMYWTFEDVQVFDKIRETVIAGNEGNFDRLSEVVAGQR
jgi:Activator of Hsp90 ATPase homolog 1-like protein